MAVYRALPRFNSVLLTRYAPLPTLVHLELNNAKTYNSLSPSLFTDWNDSLRWAAGADDVHGVVVSGRGEVADAKRVFCSGMAMSKEILEAALKGDTSAVMGKGTAHYAHTLIDTLIEYPKLLVAAVNGHAYGMAVSTLPLYDMAFALPNRTFKLPFSEVGVCAEGCSSVTFPRILGPTLANKMLHLSEPQQSEVLESRGLLSIMPDSTPDTLPEAVLSYLARSFGAPANATEAYQGDAYANLSLESIVRSKALARPAAEIARLKEVNTNEIRNVEEMLNSKPFVDGVKRFLAKQQQKKQKL